nr:unnamed protein product [Digitaria exilis]
MISPVVAASARNSDEDTCLHALELISAFAVSMTVKAAIELGLIDALSTAGGRAMTAAELSAQLPAADKAEATASVDRLLRLLASYNVVKCETETSPNGEALRRYTAAPVCRWLTGNSGQHLGAAVAAGGPVAFERAHGVPMFRYMGANNRLNKLFNKAMAQQTMIVMGKLMESFKGFEGVSVLVDVGGGTGATLEMITSRYKHIRGINFDLPHCLSDAPAIPGR